MEDRHRPRCGSGGVTPQRFPYVLGPGLDLAEPVNTCRGLVMDLSCTRRIPAPVTCLDHRAAKSACADASVVPGQLAQIRREESRDVPSATSALLADSGPTRR